MILWRETPKLHAMWDSLRSGPLSVGRTRITGIPATPASSPSAIQILLNADAYRALDALPDGVPLNFEAETRETVSHTWNAVGRILGSDPKRRDEVILLSAHLDHLGEKGPGPDRIYNGADDDASGTIAVLTLAQAMAAGPPPQRSIVFALFGSEEVGSFGARYFIARPTLALESIIANLEFEMIGRSDAAVAEHTLWLTGWERTNLGPELARHGARLVADPHPSEHFFVRSDNITLARRGIVAQTVSSYGLHEQYHQPSDDISHIDFQHMTESINSMLAPISWLANSGFKPAWLPGGRP
jgi:Zn-dependent M28 family amino/carboxypeptidase